MNENYHAFEPHTETAADHFCDQCFGYHDWRAGCAEEPLEIEPHSAFDIVRPDEVAECWEGVTNALYAALWACVSEYTAASPEASEEPCWGMDCVADFWGKFTREQQESLNALAVLNEA